MALNSNDMSQAIQNSMNALPNKPTPAEANNTFALAISDYIIDNIEIIFSWTAQLSTPPYLIDPITEIKGKIEQFSSFTLNPPGSGGLTDWTNQLYNQMLNGIIKPEQNIISSPLNYFQFTSQPLGSITWLNLSFSDISTFPEGLTNICEQIINRIKTMIQSLSFIPAAHIIAGIGTYNATICTMTGIL